MTGRPMPSKRRKSFVLTMMCFLTAAPAITCAAPSPLADVVPAGALVYGELTSLDDLIDRIQESPHLATLLNSPQYQQFEQSPQYRKFMAGRQIIETQIGMDLWTAAKAVLGGQVAVGLYRDPGKKQPDVVLAIRVNDVAALAQLKERLEAFVVLLEGDQIDTSGSIAGQTVYSAKIPGGRVYGAIGDDWVAITNVRELLAKTAGALTGSPTDSVAKDEPFQLMNQQMGEDHLLKVFVNTAAITEAMGRRFVPQKLDNPLVSLLFGGIGELVASSPYGGLTLDVEDSFFTLTAGIAGGPDDAPETHQAFFSDPKGTGTPAIPVSATRIAGVSFYRDFAEWYRQREQLIRSEALPGFDKFEAGLGNLLPGKDFGEDILPMMGNNLTFVAAPQDYDHLDGQPGVKLPALGLIVDLAKPEEAADVFQLFFQTLASIMNIQAGQQGRQPWVMTSETHQDTQISYARFLQKPSGERLPLVFNFIPAAARVGDQYVITSSLGLCRQLIDELKKPASNRQRRNRNFNVEFSFEPFADALESNQEFFRAQAIQDGKSVQQANQEFGLVIEALRYFQTLQFSTNVKEEAFQVELEGTW
jgi:hypothetical protein